jgi:hypothetical protein
MAWALNFEKRFRQHVMYPDRCSFWRNASAETIEDDPGRAAGRSIGKAHSRRYAR